MWTIYLKEMLELVRDRKTFIFTILIPIFAVPAIVTAFGYFSSSMFDKAHRAELPYAVFGKQHAPEVAALFAADRGFREVALPDRAAIRAAIDKEVIKFALVIPDGFQQRLDGQRQAAVELHYNNAVTVDVIRKRVQAVLEEENVAQRERALSALGLSQQQLSFALNPIKLEERSTAGKRERLGAVVGGMLPYLLLMGCLMAAMYPAIDLGAGEKERGTLETLLLAPVPRGSIVLAKFLVLFTVGMTSSLLMVGSMSALLFAAGSASARSSAQSGMSGLTEMMQSIGAGELAMVALMLAPSAAIFASILLSLSIYAKSYKEAAGLISPLMILTLLPVMAALLPGVELNWMWAMVPLTNVALAMKELVKGTMNYNMFAVILLSTTLTAGALLALCSWWFKREKVLFRN
ncbi:ABC transporter permease [Pseudoduganella namucuonensis]|uniref:Sodium transport system permease protein n=1 Tax=Pseudoduganella namucuonensis TaxID=1035707 RepID=A0A1I7EU27_9BURK|nr:ABC transporter permease [Pseudoduganella namucuonensis]SFU27431.1 sodium transport system permease protein [Pseudoduganella namucuonensis]